MRAIFCVSIEVGNGPVIDVELIQYLENGELIGGFSCIGHVPQAKTCLVQIESSEEMIDKLAEMDDYLFVEDVSDGS